MGEIFLLNGNGVMRMDEPLIYTSKGNLPIASLAYRHEWQDTADAVTFVEEYRLDDEVVKRAVHVLSKHGVTGELVAGGIA